MTTSWMTVPDDAPRRSLAKHLVKHLSKNLANLPIFVIKQFST